MKRMLALGWVVGSMGFFVACGDDDAETAVSDSCEEIEDRIATCQAQAGGGAFASFDITCEDPAYTLAECDSDLEAAADCFTGVEEECGASLAAECLDELTAYTTCVAEWCEMHEEC